MPPYSLEYLENAAKEERRDKKREVARQNTDVMNNPGVWVEHFGKHWGWIVDLRRGGKWGIGGFPQACYFFSQLQSHGLRPGLVKKRHLLDIINVSYPGGESGQLVWQKRVQKRMKKLFQKLQKKKTKVAIVQREDRQDEEPVDTADPPSLIIRDNIERYDNIVATQSLLGPFDLATGQMGALHEEPADTIHQLHLPFRGGFKYYPEFLVCPYSTLFFLFFIFFFIKKKKKKKGHPETLLRSP
jgi:hypothetical protein